MSFKELPLLKENKGTVLFYPFVPRSSFKEVKKVLSGRWIGQGPKVEYFEKIFKKMFCNKYNCLAVGSGTDALHLAYILAGLKKGDEVIAPVFTCTATNIPLLYMGIKIKFADIDVKTMNMSIESIESIISKKTKAIIVVHYGGLPCDMDKIQKIATKYKIPIIEDAAHALGAKYLYKKKYQPVGSCKHADISTFSLHPVKTITAGEFIQEFNEQNKDTLTVSKEFKKEVTPVLTRVLQKRGAAMTDEQYLGFLILKDVGLKAIIVTQVKSSMNEMLNVIKDYTQAIRESGTSTPPPPTQPSNPKPSRPTPTSQPKFEEPDHASERFNFEDNETVMAATVQAHKVPNSGRAKAIAARKKDEEMNIGNCT